MADSVSVIEEQAKETPAQKPKKEKKPKQPSRQTLALKSIQLASQHIYVPVAVDNNGNITSTHQLALSYLYNSAYPSRLSYNTFSSEILLDNSAFNKDKLCNLIAKEISLKYPINGGVKKDQVWEAIQAIALEHVVDPVADFIEGLPTWDKKPRIESFFVRHFGVEEMGCGICRAGDTAQKRSERNKRLSHENDRHNSPPLCDITRRPPASPNFLCKH